MRKILLITCGVISLSLGVVGIVIPLLPTTPFLLLASACFVRSSERLNLWLVQHRVFGRHIRTYQRFRAVSYRTKVLSLALLWASITCSVLFVVSHFWVRALLLVIALGVSTHILRVKTLTKAMSEELNREGAAGPPGNLAEKHCT